ncbi:MAG: carboxypeptidase-like regulatory domain-containing protein [Bacteroidales bacterium]|nr:carboxypeptidase-like regulatory domain-containing protein [Bacteroidales bacterium]
MKKFLILLLCSLSCLSGHAQDNTDDLLIRISGVVRDQFTREKMIDVSVSVPGTNIGTITNEDGVFSLKLKSRPAYIELSSIGYKTSKVRLTKDIEELKISMTPSTMVLKELVVYSGQADKLIRAALDKRKENNVQTTELHTSFYRETIEKGSRFIDVSEAILSTYKAGYNMGIGQDKVKVVQGRHLMSQRGKDTLAVKVMGGPTMPIILDAVKNEDIIFNSTDMPCYKFEMEEAVTINDQPQFVISFSPTTLQPWALYYGKVYLDKQTLAFTRIELQLDMRDQAKATRHMLFRKPNALRFRPRELSTVINYKNGRISYMKNTFRFNCDWKKRLFAYNYTCISEMVVTDVEENYKGPKIMNKEKFGERESFYDAVQYFSDPNFWGDYNIIEPTESLEKAVNKLKKVK